MRTHDDDGLLHWFGRSWGSPMNYECPNQPTPVGRLCLRCHQPIRSNDRGVTMIYIPDFTEPAVRRPEHLDCFERSTTGHWPIDQTHRRYTYEATEEEKNQP